ncbi:hypothetical protein O181_046203 [Austropuccinia psidii MF-1]|uniref:Uncharacterized protein n=1 Tax=Austropuccinia psidii MF-1 TaxID=1389203 RepID=A0A9Q3DTJ8_9BASI|nr:hypothetical protein [Austropuccinia psidii MF-1]
MACGTLRTLLAQFQRGGPSAPKSKWAHLSKFLTPKAKNHHRTQIGHKISPWPLATIRGHQISSKKGFPSSSGEYFLFFNAPHTQGPGVVHIWYNIPLGTIFAQQSNGDTFRTQLPDSKSSLKSITNFEGGLFSYSVWQFPGGYQKTIQELQPPGPAGVGLSILTRIILRATLRGNQIIFNHCKAIMYSEFLGKLNWSIQVVIKHPVWPWLNWAN